MSFAFTAEEMNSLSPAQKAAVVDACVVGVMADGQVSPEEAQKFDAEFHKVPWGIPEPAVNALIQEAFGKVTGLRSREEIVAFIQGISQTLPTQELREKTMALLAKVVFINQRVNENESRILDAVSAIMQIPMPRMALIAAEVRSGV